MRDYDRQVAAGSSPAFEASAFADLAVDHSAWVDDAPTTSTGA